MSAFEELIDAVVDEEVDRVSELISTCDNVNQTTDDDEWNLLHFALQGVVGGADASLVQLLISSGVDVEAADRLGWTPLHFAVRNGCSACVSALINAGASLNVVDSRGISPLHRLLVSNVQRLDLVRLLLEAGAKPDFGSKGTSARKYAEAVCSPEMESIRELFSHTE
ncbi:MAG: ankyrin repeat domain-containing protein [Planctomycetaceae bacterium]|nr:ankyrin repeat domain-containing protein [Planctomycetaceae bacterium]MCA9032437.1 ankyrin repeat domain-containing protein [Planctomycetaceae bacterium]MCA9042976.1 ankyrin repeat domain-containing protein [Planctomycetaceae bacterium]MCB9952725.1 ankyrin repeat domain-containing protein [Planctomycetaceae bacterium]